MKKSTKKTINYLKRFIGHEIIRTKPAGKDWSYTGDDPILLVGFTSDGLIRYQYTGFDLENLGSKERVLPIHFTDSNWITYKKALRAENNKLNQWKGKKIRRICITCRGIDDYISGEAPTLISASKHHMVIMHNDFKRKGKKRVLGPDFVKFENWELAE